MAQAEDQRGVERRKASRTTVPNATRRLLVLSAGLLVWMLVIAGRLVGLQIIRYGEFTQRAARQQQRTVEVAPRRGVIYDRNGHELAMTVSVDSIFAVPSEIPDPANAASLLAGILQVDPHEVLAHLESSRSFAWIARKIDNAQSARIRELNLKGIYFQKEFKRFYPKRELAAQVLGYVGTDDEGLGGIEHSFDEKLRGKPGKMLVSIDARQRSLGRVEKQPEAGANLVLTLDEQIQYIAEKELDRALSETGSEAGTVVVQDPATGEILALASRPTFNPNLFRNVSPSQLKNRSVSDVYEPGSTFKIVTLSAALEEKLARPEEVVDCQMGSITIFGHKIHDHKPFGDLTVSQIMQKSSDVGAIKMGLRLGEERLDRYIRAYGFGSQTGIELPGETRGMAKPVSRWSKISIGAISMGQEVGVSPLQLVSMVSTIANDGVYSAPRIVAGMVEPAVGAGDKPRLLPVSKTSQRRVVSPLTAAEMRQILADTVLYGTGKKAILDGYTSAGKTGTAQKVDPRTHRYSPTNYIASFAGFAPVNRPAVSIYVVLDSPKMGGHQGGMAAAPVFARVAQQVLAYRNVPHDTDIRDTQRLLLRAKASEADFSEGSPDHLSEEPELDDAMADATVTERLIAPTPVREATASTTQKRDARLITASFHPAATNTQTRDTSPDVMKLALEQQQRRQQESTPTTGTVIVDAGSHALAPSVLGKTVRAALEAAQQSGLEMEVIGSGIAREQVPAPGQPLATGAHMVVRFSR